MWSSPFLKGLFIALLSLPLLLSAFLPLPAPDIPYLNHIGTPLPKHPNGVTRGYISYFWVSDAEVLFRDDRKPGMHPKLWNWRTGKITALPGYTPPANSTRCYGGFWPSPDGRYLLFAENEGNRKKPYREWLYLLHLRSSAKKPGSLEYISGEHVVRPGWFPDSSGFIFRRALASWNKPTAPVKICIKNVSDLTTAQEIVAPHLSQPGYISSLLGVTSDGNMVHLSSSQNGSAREHYLIQIPLHNVPDSATRYPLIRPRSLATISFGPVRVSVNNNTRQRPRLLWIEQRTANPLHHLGHQINQTVANLRLRWSWYFQVETYSILWVSDVDGTNFRQIGRTPPNTSLVDEQWIPNSSQVAIRLQERNPDNSVKSERFYFCPVE